MLQENAGPVVAPDLRRACIDDAILRIAKLNKAGEAVWMSGLVPELRREHPDCGMSEADLAELLHHLVIEQRGSIDGG